MFVRNGACQTAAIESTCHTDECFEEDLRSINRLIRAKYVDIREKLQQESVLDMVKAGVICNIYV